VKFAEIQACPTLLGSGGKWLMDYIGSTDRFQPVLWGVIFFLLFRFVLSGLNLLNLSTTAGDLFGLDWSITTGFYQCFFFRWKIYRNRYYPSLQEIILVGLIDFKRFFWASGIWIRIFFWKC
jgi:hypothetical protein